MPAPFKCNECNFETKVKDALAGKKIKCPKCQAVGTVGAAAAEGAAPAKKKKSATESTDDLLSINLNSYQDVEVPEGEELEETPVKKKPKAKKKKAKATLDPQVKVAAIGFSLLSMLVIAGIVYTAGPVVMEKYQAFINPPEPVEKGKAGANGAAPAN